MKVIKVKKEKQEAKQAPDKYLVVYQGPVSTSVVGTYDTVDELEDAAAKIVAAYSGAAWTPNDANNIKVYKKVDYKYLKPLLVIVEEN